MRSGLIEVHDVRFEKAVKLLFLEDQEVIQAFSPHASRKRSQTAFACGVRYGVQRILMPLVVPRAQNVARICSHYPGSDMWRICPYGVASRSCCATQGSVGDRVTFTWITFRDCSSMRKKANSGRKKRSVTCKKSQASPPTPLLHDCAGTFSRSVHGRELARTCFIYF